MRNALDLDPLNAAVGGVAALFAADAEHPDNIILDIAQGESASGFGHPICLNTPNAGGLPPVTD